jgi:hypothetical protein
MLVYFHPEVVGLMVALVALVQTLLLLVELGAVVVTG